MLPVLRQRTLPNTLYFRNFITIIIIYPYLVRGFGVGAISGRRSSAKVPPDPELDPLPEPLELSDHVISDILKISKIDNTCKLAHRMRAGYYSYFKQQ